MSIYRMSVKWFRIECFCYTCCVFKSPKTYNYQMNTAINFDSVRFYVLASSNLESFVAQGKHSM